MNLIKAVLTHVVLFFITMLFMAGAGFLVSKVFSFTYFQSVVLCLLTSIFVFIVDGVMGLKLTSRLLMNRQCDDDNCEDCMDYDPDFDADEDYEAERSEVLQKKKLSRNAKCFCGSGKKYKHCCLSDDISF